MFYPGSYGRFCLNIVNKSNFESFYIQIDDYVDYDYCSKPRQSDSFQSSEALNSILHKHKFKTKIKRNKFRFILPRHKAVDYCSSAPCGDNHVLLCHRRYLQCLLTIRFNNTDWMNSRCSVRISHKHLAFTVAQFSRSWKLAGGHFFWKRWPLCCVYKKLLRI